MTYDSKFGKLCAWILVIILSPLLLVIFIVWMIVVSISTVLTNKERISDAQRFSH
jgi:hypothetical protein